jgi:fused signal recognition particle receptor
MGIFDFFKKNKPTTPADTEAEAVQLEQGIAKTKANFFDKIAHAVAGKTTIDNEVLDNLENALITSDVGVKTTLKIIKSIETRVAKDKYLGTDELNKILKEEVAKLLAANQATPIHSPQNTKPYIIMVVGVNGVGKTTTIGKLANMLVKNGNKVVLGAADTFRAAAVDQLKIWAERVNVPIVMHGMNTDPSAVAYDAVQQGVDMGADVVIIDTAGRLHTKVNLMHELSKIKRVMQKIVPDAPHEILLVLDGSTGQNAFVQATEFTKATDVNALAITKLDGTAKGGVVIGISDQFNIPVKYIGVGEGINDLQLFDNQAFVQTLFK